MREHETARWAWKRLDLALAALFWEVVYATRLDQLCDLLERKLRRGK